MTTNTRPGLDPPRWIDRVQPSEEPKEMKVLCLGLSRTGTMSLWTALQKLGYTPYHFKEMSSPGNIKDRHLLCWREAFLAKLYNSGKTYGNDEFIKLLQRYDAVTDAPCVNFSDELLAAYPNAKVVLSKRDPNKWLESTLRSYHAVIESPVFRIGAAIDPALSILDEVFRLVLCDWTGGDWRSRQKLLEAYHRHNEHIRQVVPKENLLEWEPKDGWRSLCEFLEKPVPEEPFPYSNKGDDVANGVVRAARYRIAKWALAKIAIPSLTVAAVLAGWLAYRIVIG